MKAIQQVESGQNSEVASLLIPLTETLLLLPNVTVAEVVPVGQVKGIESAPNWLLGELQWRELSVPLISIELLNEQEPPKRTAHTRVAVLNTTGLNDDVSFIAVLTQGLPRLARVTPDEISLREDAKLAKYDALAITWAGEQAVLPDLAALEQKYLDYQSGVK